jgi:hypothetical protein
MHIIPIAWLYVALMMAIAEATSPSGTVLGAIITFVFYGVAPIALVVYLMGAPGRHRALKAKEAADTAKAGASPVSCEPNAGRHTTTDAVPPVRKEP